MRQKYKTGNIKRKKFPGVNWLKVEQTIWVDALPIYIGPAKIKIFVGYSDYVVLKLPFAVKHFDPIGEKRMNCTNLFDNSLGYDMTDMIRIPAQYLKKLD